jgi:hypothetical protein
MRFDGITYDTPNGDVYVSLLQGLAGDYNGDNQVDNSDLAVWQANFGSTTNRDADGNGDRVVNAADYVVWRDAVSPGSESRSGTVPEPSTAVLTTLISVIVTIMIAKNRVSLLQSVS